MNANGSSSLNWSRRQGRGNEGLDLLLILDNDVRGPLRRVESGGGPCRGKAGYKADFLERVSSAMDSGLLQSNARHRESGTRARRVKERKRLRG